MNASSLLTVLLLTSAFSAAPSVALAENDFEPNFENSSGPEMNLEQVPILGPLFELFNGQPQKRVFEGSFEQIVCMKEGKLNVRSADLRRVIFTVSNHEPVKVFQGWGDNKRSRYIDGREYTFIKVQFPRREQRGQSSEGWVADSLVTPYSQCRSAPQQPKHPKPVQPTPPGRPVPPTKPTIPSKPLPPVTPPNNGGTEIRGLADPNCCEFPTKGEVTTDFAQGMRRFGANRSGGNRLHAACDLYRYKNEPILSVAPGTVIRGIYAFYQGTYALEVRHSGGFIVRYGEITGKTYPGANRGGQKVRMGQEIGYMGKVNSNCCEPMLHFELFSGARNGALGGGGAYRRRSDLLNPTTHLKTWEAEKFRSRK